MAVTIDRYLDIDSEEFKKLENAGQQRRFTLRAIELGAVTVDKAGYIWTLQGLPVYSEQDGKNIGLRYSAKAVN